MKRLRSDWAWPLMIPIMGLLCWAFIFGLVQLARWIVEVASRK